MVKKAFLTDSRREVLDGTTDLTGQSLHNAKSRIRTRARLALEELIEVATSPAIDNKDVFDPEQIDILIHTLLNGSGGVIDLPDSTELTDQETPMRYSPTPKEVRDRCDEYRGKAWSPEEDYANKLYVSLDGKLRGFHKEEEDQ